MTSSPHQPASNPAVMLRVAELTRRFVSHEPAVVRNACFDVAAGEILVLLGPSGCGKTTTLRAIAGFDRPDAGVIEVAGEPVVDVARRVFVPPQRRRVGFVFQDYALFPHLDVLRNVMYGLSSLPRAQRRRRALEALDRVGLAALAHRRPQALSGGQQQRVALARSIAPEPRLILLDEPFSNLDAQLRRTTRAEVRDLLHAAGMTAVLVTHDQEEALTFGDRLAVMLEGRIEQSGPPRMLYEQPATEAIARFLGQTNLLTGEAQGSRLRSALGEIELARPASGQTSVSLRPEHLAIQPAGPGGHANATIESCEYKGHDMTYRVRLHATTDQVLLVHLPSAPPLPVGAAVIVTPRSPAVPLNNTSSNGEA